MIHEIVPPPGDSPADRIEVVIAYGFEKTHDGDKYFNTIEVRVM